MNLFINTLLDKRDAELKLVDCERVLWLDQLKDCAVTISIIRENALPEFKLISSLEQELVDGTMIKRESDPYARFKVPNEKLNSKEITIRDNAWNCIKEIVELEPNIYDPKERYQIIKGEIDKTKKGEGKGKKFYYKYLRYYWAGGKMVNALLPRFRKCGGRGKKKNPTRKMGRPRETSIAIDPKLKGVIVTEGTRKIFDAVIRKVYLRSNRRDSVRFAYIEMLKTYYQVGTIKKGNYEIPVIPPEHELPSIAQFRYHIRKNYTKRKQLIEREGEVTFNRDFRPLLGSETRRATGPGQIFEVDATVADVYLVSSEDSNRIIGRPVVYIVVDVYTHMTVGVYVGFEGPSWLGLMMAIENTAEDKVGFCKQFDITISEEEWPCQHMPEIFFADRGEMESKSADSLANALGIKVKNTPPYRADLKGIVEQQFRTLNLTLQPWTPGAVKKEYQKRGGPDYVLDAKLTLKEFTAMMIEMILHRNNHHYMEYYPLDKDQALDNVRPVPRDLWNWGVAHNHFLKVIDPEIVRLNILPEAIVTVNREGIYFEGMYYGSDEIILQGGFIKGKSPKVTIAYDRRCMNHVYVKTEQGKGMIKCTLLSKSSRFNNMSLEEVKLARYEEKLSRSLYKTPELNSEVALSKKLQTIAEKATERSEENEDSSLTKSERKSNIRGNRAVERDNLRKEQAFELGEVDHDDESEPVDNVIPIEVYKPKSKLGMLEKLKTEGDKNHG
ncbi:Mu transposase C-terminal domain-containing protein [Paenibacillus sp. FSL R7-0297]|uniref:Mu transposase C-terminal domain-containing protein n=1 Tax=Paenibacillus sp. FSL R7-0297 TaxID=2921680 RepID=UPI0030F4CD48